MLSFACGYWVGHYGYFDCLLLWVVLVASIICDGGPGFAVVGHFGGFAGLFAMVVLGLLLWVVLINGDHG